MTDNNKKSLIAGIIIILLLLGGGTYILLNNKDNSDDDDKKETKITNYQECVDAGGSIMESYPERCSKNGETFTRELTGEEKDIFEGRLVVGTINQEVQLHDRSIKITDVDRNFDDSVEEYTDLPEITEENEYVRVRMEMKNISDETIQFNLTDFKLLYEGGSTHAQNIGYDLERTTNIPEEYGVIQPNQTLYLRTISKVPKDAKLTFEYVAQSWNNQKIKIEL